MTKKAMTGTMAARRAALWHCTVLALACCALASTAVRAQGTPSPALSPTTPPLVLVLGDSLSAEYGLARGKGWVALLEHKLAADKRPATIVNASISGDTTSGGRSRLPALLKRHRPQVVVIELGGNDALRGLPLKMTSDNLTALVRSSREAGAKVLLLGMQMPPNYGRQYGADFAALYGKVAAAEKVSLVPFMLKGVGDVPNSEALFQADRIHPLAQAHPIILSNVLPVLVPLLR
ncbi:MAG: hypothetical protein RLZZ618_3120 [Pseudomonadota bacterium]|jgi:acyl-CoA thioesterase-1